ncbi:MAG: RNHCP domain-containing protein [Frankia sp.]|nr:RNHCP domain-containing protein [Frankia sp.]
MTRRFTRTTEDFPCLVCGAAVRGDGYTNHCPRCLWSRHVDVFPGDRAADCGGLMRPIAVEQRAHDVMLTHRCEDCGHQRRNRTAAGDDRDAVLRLAAEIAAAGLTGGRLAFAGPTATSGGARRADGGATGPAGRTRRSGRPARAERAAAAGGRRRDRRRAGQG